MKSRKPNIDGGISIERLSLIYWRNGKEVKHSSNKGLVVMLLSLRKGYNCSASDVRSLCYTLSGSYQLKHCDRRKLCSYIRREYERLRDEEKELMSPRYVRCGYALWTRGYEIGSRMRYERSLRRFADFYALKDLSIKELSEAECKIRKSGIHYATKRDSIAGWWRRPWR